MAVGSGIAVGVVENRRGLGFGRVGTTAVLLRQVLDSLLEHNAQAFLLVVRRHDNGYEDIRLLDLDVSSSSGVLLRIVPVLPTGKWLCYADFSASCDTPEGFLGTKRLSREGGDDKKGTVDLQKVSESGISVHFVWTLPER